MTLIGVVVVSVVVMAGLLIRQLRSFTAFLQAEHAAPIQVTLEDPDSVTPGWGRTSHDAAAAAVAAAAAAAAAGAAAVVAAGTVAAAAAAAAGRGQDKLSGNSNSGRSCGSSSGSSSSGSSSGGSSSGGSSSGASSRGGSSSGGSGGGSSSGNDSSSSSGGNGSSSGSLFRYLQQRRDHQGPQFTYEVVVVDDGSRDGTVRQAQQQARHPAAPQPQPLRQQHNSQPANMTTTQDDLSDQVPIARTGTRQRHSSSGSGCTTTASQVAQSFSRAHGFDTVRVLRVPVNRGKVSRLGRQPPLTRKGHAVKRGMMVARGEYCLFMDADGATRFRDLELLEGALANLLQGQRSSLATGEGPLGAALGSRAHLESAAKARRSALRNFLTWGFHMCVMLVAGGRIRDTQCGFKLFTRRAAALLYSNQRLQRWCFDVELIWLADNLGVPLTEVSVQWTEMPGSKIRPTSILFMAFELLALKVAYQLGGLWHVASEAEVMSKKEQ
ncbi:hypothetical protein QJQ45_010622 [Haematococcus lacustris]|nr:hypothetical protein QJQ45_010622 [Haematococcus lacustris]